MLDGSTLAADGTASRALSRIGNSSPDTVKTAQLGRAGAGLLFADWDSIYTRFTGSVKLTT